MTKVKKSTGKIYQAYNKITGLSYIGQTVQSVNWRKYQHYFQAKSKKTKNYHFQNSLLKHDAEDWEWNLLETSVPKDKLDEFEIMYIEKFDSYRNGYNSTVGGNGNSNKNAKKHKLYHPLHGWQEMTMREYHQNYGVDIASLCQVVNKNYKKASGWCLSIEERDKPNKKRPQIVHILEYKGEQIKGNRFEIAKLTPLSTADVCRFKSGAGCKHQGYSYIGCIYPGDTEMTKIEQKVKVKKLKYIAPMKTYIISTNGQIVVGTYKELKALGYSASLLSLLYTGKNHKKSKHQFLGCV